MPYTDVEWTGGGVDAGGDETKLTGMATAIDYLRADAANHRTVSSFAGSSEGAEMSTVGVDGSSSFRLRMQTGALSITSDALATGSIFAIAGMSSIDISGLQVGVFHQVDLLVDIKRTPASDWETYATLGRFWFIRSAEDDRMRIQGRLRGTPDQGWYANALGGQTNKFHVEVFGMCVAIFRAGSGDPRYATVTFDGPIPGPAEFVSDTDMNQLTTNQKVVRDRLSAHHLGGTPVHGFGNEALLAKGELNKSNYRVQLQFFVDGVEVGNVATTGGTLPSYTTLGIANRTMPNSPSWGLSVAEVRFRVANGGSQTFTGQGGPGTPGWLIARSRFWRSPDDLYFHGVAAVRAWTDRNSWLSGAVIVDPNADHFAVKTAGVSLLATRVGTSFPTA